MKKFAAVFVLFFTLQLIARLLQSIDFFEGYDLVAGIALYVALDVSFDLNVKD